MKLLKAACLLYLSFLSYSCDDNPEMPGDNTPPGKRNYIWSIDSVAYDSTTGFISLQCIWGSSPADVWGTGNGSLWHYDGSKWSRVNRNGYIQGVWGTSQHDVWTFGSQYINGTSSPFVSRFNGIVWSEFTGDETQMPAGFTDIYGIRENHFWVSSFNHVCEYKDGVWKKYSFPENYLVQSIGGEGGNVYLTAYPIGVDSLYLMHYKDNNFYILDRTILIYSEGKFGECGLTFANQKIYTFERCIYTRKSVNGYLPVSNWVKELTLPYGGFSNSFARNNKDIWAVGINTSPYHYNGEDWSPVIVGNVSYYSHFKGIWGNGEEIFMCDAQNGIVYHGR
jgi:hypothetical protein